MDDTLRFDGPKSQVEPFCNGDKDKLLTPSAANTPSQLSRPISPFLDRPWSAFLGTKQVMLEQLQKVTDCPDEHEDLVDGPTSSSYPRPRTISDGVSFSGTVIFSPDTIVSQLHDRATLRKLASLCDTYAASHVTTPRQLGQLFKDAGYEINIERLDADAHIAYNELMSLLEQVPQGSLSTWDLTRRASQPRHAQRVVFEPIRYRSRPGLIRVDRAPSIVHIAQAGPSSQQGTISDVPIFVAPATSKEQGHSHLCSDTAAQLQEAQPSRLTLSNGDTFLLGKRIGSGQYGAVYCSLHADFGTIVAIKRIPMQDQSPTERQKLMQEVALLRKLKSQWITSYVGFAEDSGFLSIATEYIEGGSLLTIIKTFGGLSEALAARLCRSIILGLEYLHAQDVVHCDLKCANVLLTKSGQTRLADFGVSMHLGGDSTIKGDVNGTPNWLAPEVITLRGTSKASDIWSLGCTLIEMLQAKPPYADLNPMSVLYAIVERGPPPPPSDASSDLTSFLQQCFVWEPRARPSAAALFHHTWLQMAHHALRHDGMGIDFSNGAKVWLPSDCRSGVLAAVQGASHPEQDSLVSDDTGSQSEASPLLHARHRSDTVPLQEQRPHYSICEQQSQRQGSFIAQNGSNCSGLSHALAGAIESVKKRRRAPCMTRYRVLIRRKTTEKVLQECCIM